MASNINPANIDVTYPIAGQDNDTQGFRDNFTNIKNNFTVARGEISDLQSLTTITPTITTVPVGASAYGRPGQFAYDTNQFYVCISNNTWVRADLSTWPGVADTGYGNATVAIYLPVDPTIISFKSNLGNVWANIAYQAGISSAALQAAQITALNSNVAAANVNISSVTANVTSANTAIAGLRANITAANSAIATLQTQVYSNTNVSTYLSGNITTGNITNSGGMTVTGTATVGSLTITGSEGIGGNLAVSGTVKYVGTPTNAIGATGNVTVNVSASSYQTLTTSGNVWLQFSNWAPASATSSVELLVNVANTAHNLVFPSSVFGTTGLVGINANTLTFANTGNYKFKFTSSDSGTTVLLEESNPALRPYNSSSNLITATSGAISLSTNTSIYNPSPANTAGTATLANGVNGQIKVLGSKGSSTWIVTVASAAWGGSKQVNFTAANQSVTLMWSQDLGYWYPISVYGASLS